MNFYHRHKKSILVYLCIWILVAIPTLSYAWLPLVNAAARVLTATRAGQVLISQAGRAVKYAVPAEKLKDAAIAVYGMCMTYNGLTGDTCGEYGKRVYDYLTKNGWQTEETDNGIEIYKAKECVYYCSYTDNNICFTEPRSLASHYFNEERRYRISLGEEISDFSYDYYKTGTVYYSYKHFSTFTGEKQYNEIGFLVKEKPCKDKKQYLTEEDVWDMIQDPSNGFDDQDITNILNYDYSDKSVTINNHTYNGGDIKYSFDPNININRDGDGTDGKPGWGLEIDPTFAPKLVPILINPKIKIGLPDINYNNCTANAEGTIVSCDKLEREYDIDIDGDGKKGNDDPTCQYGYTLKDGKCVKVDPKPPTTDNPKPPAEQKPWVCTTSEFTRKVCDLIDWTQKEHALNNDTQMTIETDRLPPMDTNRIKFGSQCPPAETHTISLMGVSVNFKIKYDQYCDFMVKFKPFAIGLASISAVLIIAGRKHG